MPKSPSINLPSNRTKSSQNSKINLRYLDISRNYEQCTGTTPIITTASSKSTMVHSTRTAYAITTYLQIQQIDFETTSSTIAKRMKIIDTSSQKSQDNTMQQFYWEAWRDY